MVRLKGAGHAKQINVDLTPFKNYLLAGAGAAAGAAGASAGAGTCTCLLYTSPSPRD